MNVFAARLEGPLAESVLRLVSLLDNPQAIAVLKPAIMREICFWLLTGRHGADICKIVLPQTHLHRISKAIRFLRENFTRTVRMEELADEARMSPSSFHQHFKAVTGSTPRSTRSSCA
jgi:AraC-like DNA-binding protein